MTRAFKPVQQYKIAIAGTASVAQQINELATIRALGKHPILKLAALSSHAVVKVGTDSSVTADASKVDIVTNGTFATDTDWTKDDVDVTIAGGKAVFANATDEVLSQEAPLMREGYSYLTTFTTERSAGGVTLSLGGTAGTERTSANTFNETIVAGATGLIEFTGNGFTGTVDTFTALPNLIPGDSFTLIDGATPVDMAVNPDVTHLSVISEDESDTGNLHVTVGYYE